jgi:serine/threonine protein kinase
MSTNEEWVLLNPGTVGEMAIPISALPHKRQEEYSLEEITQALGSYYKPVGKIHEGSNRIVYKFLFNGCEERAVAVDKVQITSPNARKAVARGYNTRHEQQIHQILAARGKTNKIMPLVDIVDFGNTRRGEQESTQHLGIQQPRIAVYDYWDGPDAKRFLDENHNFNHTEFSAVMSDVLEAIAFHINRGVYHRDIKPDNILIQQTGNFEKPMRAALADYALARRISDIENESHEESKSEQETNLGTTLHTHGGKRTLDPQLLHGQKYTLQSEIYSVAKTGLDLLLPQNNLSDFADSDERTYTQKLNETLAQLKYENARFKPWLEKNLQFQRTKRAQTLQECIKDFHKVKHTRIEKTLNWIGERGPIFATLAVIGLLAAPLSIQYGEKLRDAKRVPITSYWDANNINIEQDFFDVQMQPDVSDQAAKFMLEQSFHVTPNNIADCNFEVTLIPKNNRPNVIPFTLPGRIYIPGYEGIEISETVQTLRDNFLGIIDNWQLLSRFNMTHNEYKLSEIIPPNLPPGNYQVFVEFYAPSEKVDRVQYAAHHNNYRDTSIHPDWRKKMQEQNVLAEQQKDYKEIKFEKSGIVVAREVIHLQYNTDELLKPRKITINEVSSPHQYVGTTSIAYDGITGSLALSSSEVEEELFAYTPVESHIIPATYFHTDYKLNLTDGKDFDKKCHAILIFNAKRKGNNPFMGQYVVPVSLPPFARKEGVGAYISGYYISLPTDTFYFDAINARKTYDRMKSE